MRVRKRLGIFGLLNSGALVAATVVLSGFARAGEEVAVIGNPSLPHEIRKEDLQRLYLGKTALLEKQKVVVIDLPEEAPERKAFYEKVIGKTPTQMTRYWARALFTGEALPPAVARNPRQARDRVAREPGIGYVPPTSADKSVQILTVTEGRP